MAEVVAAEVAVPLLAGEGAATMAGVAGAFDAAGMGFGIDAGIMASDAGLAAAGVNAASAGAAGAFDAAGMGTGVDAGIAASDAGLQTANAAEAARAGANLGELGMNTEGMTQQELVQSGTGAQPPAETLGGPSTTQVGTEVARSAASQAAKGLLGDAQTPPKEGDPGWLEWFKKNKELATLGATTAMGAIGGVGQAALTRETAQKKLQGEKDMQAKTIQANSDLLSQRTQEQLNLSRGGALVNPSLPTPAGRTLRRPDGSLVFVPASGLIANAMS